MSLNKERYSFLYENFSEILNGNFVLTEDSKEKLEDESNKYLEDAKELIEEYRKSTNKLKFRGKILVMITAGFSFLTSFSFSAGFIFKTTEKVFSAVVLLVSYFLTVITGNKLQSDYKELNKIKSKLNAIKKKTTDPEKIKKIEDLIKRINKITGSGLKKVNESVDLEDLVNESYEQIITFEESVHNLFIEQVKNEHVAIVNEDVDMLNEAEETFKTKLVNFLKTAWNEFVNFINKAIATITSLQVKIHSAFLSSEKKATIEKFVNSRDDENSKEYFSAVLKKSRIESRQIWRIYTYQELDNAINKIKNYTQDGNRLIDHMDEFNKTMETLKQFRGPQPIVYKNTDNYRSEYSNSSELVRACFKVFEKRKSWIDDLKKLKDNGLKQYKEDLKNIQDGKLKSEDSLNISKIRRAVNSIVFSINYMTIDAVKIMRLVDRLIETDRPKKNYGSSGYGDYESAKKQEYEEVKKKQPPEPKIDKSDSSKWDGNARKTHNGEYVNLSADEKEWLDYIRELIKSDYTDKKEKIKLRTKAHNMGYTSESYVGF